MEEQHSMIELQGIIKRFYIGQPNELEILHGIDLKVNRGEFVSIVGSSGSGKTTMMNIIGILDRAYGRGIYAGRSGCSPCKGPGSVHDPE